MSFNILKDSLPISFLSYPMFTKIGVFFLVIFITGVCFSPKKFDAREQ